MMHNQQNFLFSWFQFLAGKMDWISDTVGYKDCHLLGFDLSHNNTICELFGAQTESGFMCNASLTACIKCANNTAAHNSSLGIVIDFSGVMQVFAIKSFKSVSELLQVLT